MTIRIILWLTALAGIFGLAGCEYPEAGYYQLTVLDGYSEIVGRFPFAVEEITDDTDMTTAFIILVPKDGGLVEVPLVNSEDVTQRLWHLAIAGADLGAGAVDLDLKHAAELFSFSGAYQPVPEWPAFGVAGFIGQDEVPGRTPVVLNGDLPPMPTDMEGAVSIELRLLSRERFEELLGTPIAEAIRLEPAGTPELEIADENPSQMSLLDPGSEDGSEPEEEDGEDEPRKRKHKKHQPNLGGRTGTRPR